MMMDDIWHGIVLGIAVSLPFWVLLAAILWIML